MVVAAGYSLNGLWRIVERSVVWQAVRGLSHSAGLGITVLVAVLLFSWKLYGWAKNRATTRR